MKFFFLNSKIWIFGKFFKFVTLALSCFDLGSDMNQYYGLSWGGRGYSQNEGILVHPWINVYLGHISDVTSLIKVKHWKQFAFPSYQKCSCLSNIILFWVHGQFFKVLCHIFTQIRPCLPQGFPALVNHLIAPCQLSNLRIQVSFENSTKVDPDLDHDLVNWVTSNKIQWNFNQNEKNYLSRKDTWKFINKFSSICI